MLLKHNLDLYVLSLICTHYFHNIIKVVIYINIYNEMCVICILQISTYLFLYIAIIIILNKSLFNV